MEALLLVSYERCGRPFPWRRTTDPYAVLVSEVMAQQYGVENVKSPAKRAFSA